MVAAANLSSRQLLAGSAGPRGLSTSVKAMVPLLIKQIANIQFTEQLKEYQDLVETGDMPNATAVVSVTPPSDVPAAPLAGGA